MMSHMTTDCVVLCSLVLPATPFCEALVLVVGCLERQSFAFCVLVPADGQTPSLLLFGSSMNHSHL